MNSVDYEKFYYLEKHLFDEVTKTFKQDNFLSAFDFFCIVIWKANRAKSKVARRLLLHDKAYCNLDDAVASLTDAISKTTAGKSRMEILIRDWGFRLPMASAILTVLYPEEFTVYDVRVCDVLGEFHSAQYRTNFDTLWTEYERYRKAVDEYVEGRSGLRDKDRWLWGKSFHDQLCNDISCNFQQAREEDETEA